MNNPSIKGLPGLLLDTIRVKSDSSSNSEEPTPIQAVIDNPFDSKAQSQLLRNEFKPEYSNLYDYPGNEGIKQNAEKFLEKQKAQIKENKPLFGEVQQVAGKERAP